MHTISCGPKRRRPLFCGDHSRHQRVFGLRLAAKIYDRSEIQRQDSSHCLLPPPPHPPQLLLHLHFFSAALKAAAAAAEPLGERWGGLGLCCITDEITANKPPRHRSEPGKPRPGLTFLGSFFFFFSFCCTLDKRDGDELDDAGAEASGKLSVNTTSPSATVDEGLLGST